MKIYNVKLICLLLIFFMFLSYFVFQVFDRMSKKTDELQFELSELRKELDLVKVYSSNKKILNNISNRRKNVVSKRILVTGGAGFIGSHLVDELMKEGHEVIVLDNISSGRRSNIEKWLGNTHFEFIHHDIVNPIWLEVDEIYHLASPASPPLYMKNPVKTLKTNLIGSINMLGLAKRNKAKILFASTSEVYGDPIEHPQRETYFGNVNTFGPRSCYDEGKRAAESLFHAYELKDNLNIRVARIFNTFGPRMRNDDGRVVSNFITQALMNKSMTVYGSGKQTRSFQYVSDLVAGLKSLMDSNITTPVNLGNPEEFNMIEFAKIIKSLIPYSTSKLVYSTSVIQDDPQQRNPDISKAARSIQWRPLVPMRHGLKQTIAYFKRVMLENDSLDS